MKVIEIKATKDLSMLGAKALQTSRQLESLTNSTEDH